MLNYSGSQTFKLGPGFMLWAQQIRGISASIMAWADSCSRSSHTSLSLSLYYAQLLQLCLTLCNLWTIAHQAPLSRGSSQFRNQTDISGISWISGRFLTHWATWEAHLYQYVCIYISCWSCFSEESWMTKISCIWDGPFSYDISYSLVSLLIKACWSSTLTLECTLSRSVAQSCPALCDPMDCSPPGKNTGVSISFFRRFWIQGLNLVGLLNDSQVAFMVKNLPANAGDTRHTGSVPGSGRSPGGANGNPLQYSCQENPMDRGAWPAPVHRVAKSTEVTCHTSVH